MGKDTAEDVGHAPRHRLAWRLFCEAVVWLCGERCHGIRWWKVVNKRRGRRDGRRWDYSRFWKRLWVYHPYMKLWKRAYVLVIYSRRYVRTSAVSHSTPVVILRKTQLIKSRQIGRKTKWPFTHTKKPSSVLSHHIMFLLSFPLLSNATFTWRDYQERVLNSYTFLFIAILV